MIDIYFAGYTLDSPEVFYSAWGENDPFQLLTLLLKSGFRNGSKHLW